MKLDDRARLAKREGKKEITCTLEEIFEFEMQTGFDLSKRRLGGVALNLQKI